MQDSATGFKVRVDGKGYDPLGAAAGDSWRRRRHFVSPAFSTHKLKQMEPLIKESTVRLTKNISEFVGKESIVEAHRLFSMFTMEVILSTAFGRALGVQDGEGGEVYADARDLFKFMHGGSATAGKIVQHLIISTPQFSTLLTFLMNMSGGMSTLPRLTEAAMKMVEMKEKEDSATSRKDLLQLMIDAGGKGPDGGLCKGEIVADAVGFLFAGHETTSVALTFTTYLLATHPEVQEKLANEIHGYFEENLVCYGTVITQYLNCVVCVLYSNSEASDIHS
jgi:cytochrome P450